MRQTESEICAKLLLIVAAMHLGLTPRCLSQVSEPTRLTPPSAITVPKTRTDCSDPETGWKIEKLNGKVKSLREEQIEYHYGSREKELTRLVTFGPAGEYIKDDQRERDRVVDYEKVAKPTFVFDQECRGPLTITKAPVSSVPKPPASTFQVRVPNMPRTRNPTAMGER